MIQRGRIQRYNCRVNLFHLVPSFKFTDGPLKKFAMGRWKLDGEWNGWKI